MEGAQTTHNVASDSMKDATTLSSPAGNRSSDHNPDSTLGTKAVLFGTVPSFHEWDHKRRILNLDLG